MNKIKTKTILLLIIFNLTLGLVFSLTSGNALAALFWERTEISEVSDIVFDIKIGDGNNDGKNEVYSNEGFSSPYGVFQFKWDGSNWNETLIKEGNFKHFLGPIADGNNDNENEIYAPKDYSEIVQIKWNGLDWDIILIENEGSGWTGTVGVGDGDNDGKNEVYDSYFDSGTWDYPLFQHKWDGLEWQKTEMALQVLLK